LSSSGLAIAPVNTYREVARDRHVTERDMLQSTVQEDGSTAPITGPAAKFSRTPTRVRSGAPRLGHHNEEILAELGFDADARRKLRDAGVV
jgi:formyl-CoA transferase